MEEIDGTNTFKHSKNLQGSNTETQDDDTMGLSNPKDSKLSCKFCIPKSWNTQMYSLEKMIHKPEERMTWQTTVKQHLHLIIRWLDNRYKEQSKTPYKKHLEHWKTLLAMHQCQMEDL